MTMTNEFEVSILKEADLAHSVNNTEQFNWVRGNITKVAQAKEHVPEIEEKQKAKYKQMEKSLFKAEAKYG